MTGRRIAVVGGGVSGITAGYVLSRTDHVTLFEADGRLGGHADTHPTGVDTGFIVYNERTYPLLTRLIPPWQPVRVLREAGSLRDGRATLTLPGGLRWVAAHRPDGYDPPNAFADELTSLPLPWRHTHQFSPWRSP